VTIQVSRLTAALGATVEGVQLCEELSQPTIDQLQSLLIEHQILFFRRQPLTPAQLVSFSRRFGELHVHPIYPVLPELPEVLVLDTHADFLPDNDNWHTDVTFTAAPPMAGVLAAKQLPSVGGDTLWSSNIAAYDALSEPLKHLLQGLTAEHSLIKSFPPARWGSDADPAIRQRYENAVARHPPVTHPVVRTHPVSERKALFVNSGFTTRIHELRLSESDALLAFLFAHAARPEFTLRWHWNVNDVAFWDNWVTQHYAVADYLPERRIMHRATVMGDRPF
jgi:taurine dioxygenase